MILWLELFLVIAIALEPFELHQTLETNSNVYEWSPTDISEFQNWATIHNKNYDSQFVVIHRMNTYLNNKHKIKNHNAQLSQDRWKTNAFSDMNDEELAQLLFPTHMMEEQDWEYFSDADVDSLNIGFLQKAKAKKTTSFPPSIDWSNSITSSEQQGMCGSCWVFATTDTAISRLAIKQKATLQQLSKSYILDCMLSSNGGCQGGSVGEVFNFINKKGAVLEKDYRAYDEEQEKCQKKDGGNIGKGNFSSVKSQANPDDAYILEALQTGPVTALVLADQSWFSYSSGVIETCNYEKNNNYVHAISIYGYNTKYWLAKNSWGTEWGDHGLFLMQRTGDSGCLDKIKRITYPLVK